MVFSQFLGHKAAYKAFEQYNKSIQWPVPDQYVFEQSLGWYIMKCFLIIWKTDNKPTDQYREKSQPSSEYNQSILCVSK